MVATLKTGVIQEPSSSTANLTLDASGGVTVGQNLSVTGTTTFTGGSTFTGNATAAAFIPSGSTVPTNGLYLPAANSVGLATASTNRLTIDSSGNVLVGTTSSTYSAANRGVIELNGTSSSLLALKVNNSAYGYLFASSEFQINNTQNSPMTFYVNGSERMRIDSSGNVGIGTTSPESLANYIFVQAGSGGNSQGVFQATDGTTKVAMYSTSNLGIVSTRTAHPLALYTNGSERARIDTSGNLLVGNTAQTGRVAVQQTDAGSPGVRAYCSSSTFTDNAFLVTVDRNTTNGSYKSYAHYNNTAGAFKFYVIDSGAIYSTSTSITAISDQSLKENIKPLETGLSEIMQLQPRRFDFIDSDAKNVAGFIAQEVQSILPDLVVPYEYNKDEEKLGLKMGDMIPTLVKAIQELSAKVDAQAAEIADLKAKVGA